MKNKLEIRREMIGLRKKLADEFKKNASSIISSSLQNIPELANADSIAVFYPTRNEPDITEFIKKQFRQSKKMFFPRLNPDTGTYCMVKVSDFNNCFTTGKFALKEPVSSRIAKDEELKEISWVVPGVAFDMSGNRIGHGNGVYDRLLKNVTGLKIGVCFGIQIIKTKLPDREPSDVSMDIVVSEKGIINCRRQE